MGTSRMTFRETLSRELESFEEAITPECFEAILRTGWLEAAVAAKQR